MMNRISVAADIGPAAAYLLLYLVLFIFSKWCWGFLVRCRLNDELVRKDNPAVAVALCGYHLGVLAVFMGALWGGSSGDLLTDLLQVGGWALAGIVFINLSGRFNDYFILHRLSIFKEITEERNCAVACALGGTSLATGLISAGAVSGEGGGLISAVVFFALGQISLAVFSYLYMRTLPFNVHEELKSGNVSAGLSFGGALVALGLIIMSSSSGPQGGNTPPGFLDDLSAFAGQWHDSPLTVNSVNWAAELLSFGLANVAAFVFLPLLRWIGDRLVVPGRPLSLEIKEDRNIGAGLIQATALISFGALLAVLI